MTPYFQQDGIVLYHGDCREVLQSLPDESVHAVVTDPPYGLSFMGKRWDYDVPSVEVWQQCLRVLKPGGHLLAFAGTRTQHRMAVRIEDAGFEIRDMIAWVYGSGFPKSLDVSKAIDKMDAKAEQHARRLRFTAWMRQNCSLTVRQANELIGCDGEASHFFTDGEQPHIATRAHFELLRPHFTALVPDDIEAMVTQRSVQSENMAAREVLQTKTQRLTDASTWAQNSTTGMFSAGEREYAITAPATEDAKRWQGWGTALKPALEPITVARKPLCGTVAENVLTHGCGGLNVDGCRVAGVLEGDPNRFKKTDGGDFVAKFDNAPVVRSEGRWPANLIHDGSDEVTGLFPESEPSRSGKRGGSNPNPMDWGNMRDDREATHGHDDAGGSAARFFYTAKADKSDRGHGNKHPTVKPVDLMRYLVRLVCPMDGLILDPFAGSGTTLVAAQAEHCRAIGIEREEQYCEFIRDERFRQRVLF